LADTDEIQLTRVIKIDSTQLFSLVDGHSLSSQSWRLALL